MLEAALRQHTAHALATLIEQGFSLQQADHNLQYAKSCARNYFSENQNPNNLLQWLLACATANETAQDKLPIARDQEKNHHQLLLNLLLFCNHPKLQQEEQLISALHYVFALPSLYIAAQLNLDRHKIKQALINAKAILGPLNFTNTAIHSSNSLNKLLALLHQVYKKTYALGGLDNELRRQLILLCISLGQELAQQHNNHHVHALLAIFITQQAREPAHVNYRGELIDLDRQQRNLWDKEAIALADYHLGCALKLGKIGRYHLEAAIESLHNQSPSYADTDWTQMLMLYNLLCRKSNDNIDKLNRIIVLWHANRAPQAALIELEHLSTTNELLATYGQFHRIKAQLLSAMNDEQNARSELQTALELSNNSAERKSLIRKLNQEEH